MRGAAPCREAAAENSDGRRTDQPVWRNGNVNGIDARSGAGAARAGPAYSLPGRRGMGTGISVPRRLRAWRRRHRAPARQSRYCDERAARRAGGAFPGAYVMTATALPCELWVDFASPYSYLALERAQPLARQAGVDVVLRPFLLGPIFQAQGWNDSPFRLFPGKGAYMMRDVARLDDQYGITYQNGRAHV